MQEMIWVTKDERSIPICNMDTDHIMNCIRKIQRNRKGWRKEYLTRLNLELEIRTLGLSSKRAS